jgi:hypothetical protein
MIDQFAKIKAIVTTLISKYNLGISIVGWRVLPA